MKKKAIDLFKLMKERQIFRKIWLWILLFLRPSIMAACITFLWYIFLPYIKPYYLSIENDEMIAALIGIFAGLYVLPVAFMLDRVGSEYVKIIDAIDNDNEEQFRKYFRSSTNPMTHVFMFVVSMHIMYFFAVRNYSEYRDGIQVIMHLSFVVAFVWQTANIIDQPKNAPWLVGKIKKEWLKPQKK